ncbi:MAG: Gfo/Idh/MocA family oxidoreductase [Pirellulales bacterium]
MSKLTRRNFLRDSAATAAGGITIGYFSGASAAQSKSPNEKLNIACVGVSGRGDDNVQGVQRENIVAICDIDDRILARASERFRKATKHNDFRRMLDQQKGIDAVVVSTADHTHAPATAAAIRLGKHAYCEKPLTHTVYEARTITKLAAEMKVATQMGTQIHATDNYRRVVELIQAGAIGPVREAHAWVDSRWHGGERPTAKSEVPAHLHWDLWLGPAPERPYHPTYLPQNWRRWWDFGNGTMGDMACHLVDLIFWALALKHPTTIAAEGPPVHPETAPAGVRVEFAFEARGEQPPVKLVWYDGDKLPGEIHGQKVPGFGVCFVGERGLLWSDYGRHQLLPKEQFASYERPAPSIPKSVGHHQEWINACKGGPKTTCHFGYSGPLTETVLLGVLAYRSGERLNWDPVKFTTGSDKADVLLQREYRKGWTL